MDMVLITQGCSTAGVRNRNRGVEPPAKHLNNDKALSRPTRGMNALDVFEGELFPSSNISLGQLKDKVDVRGKTELTLATVLT